MILAEVIRHADWADVEAVLRRAYPSAVAKMDALEEAWQELRALEPLASRLVIVVRPYAPYEEFMEDIARGAAAVSGVEPRPAQAAVASPDAPVPAVPFNLSCTPWRKWLGMHLAADALQRYAAAELAAHCLAEMTFMGFTEAAIRARVAASLVEDDEESGRGKGPA